MATLKINKDISHQTDCMVKIKEANSRKSNSEIYQEAKSFFKNQSFKKNTLLKRDPKGQSSFAVQFIVNGKCYIKYFSIRKNGIKGAFKKAQDARTYFLINNHF